MSIIYAKQFKNYPCFFIQQPDRGWEADLEHLESQIDKRTRFILVNNPSNPCGSVYSKEHLLQLIGSKFSVCTQVNFTGDLFTSITVSKFEDEASYKENHSRFCLFLLAFYR